MTREEVKERIIRVVRDGLGVADGVEIDEATNFARDLNADSLDGVEVVMKIEDEFELPGTSDEDARNMTTVRAAIDYVCKAKGIDGDSSAEEAA